MLRRFHVVLLVVAGILATVAQLAAAGSARVWGAVHDGAGRPLAGVRIIVTLPGVPSFRLETTSDERGGFEVALVDATRTYVYSYEKSGYQTLHESLKVPVGSNDRHDVELLTLAEAERVRPAVGDATPEERAIWLFNQGVEASQAGDRERASTSFEEAIGLDPRLVVARSALATLQLDEGKWAAAAGQAEAALALEPADATALRVLFQARLGLGDEERALAAAQRLAAIEPAVAAEAVLDRATAAYNAGDTETARRLAERAVGFDTSLARAHYLLGLCLAGSDAPRAREHLEAFVRLAPDDADAATAREMLRYLESPAVDSNH